MIQQSLFGALIEAETPAPSEHPGGSARDVAAALDATTFTVIDVETTGLNPAKNALLEVTAIQYRQGQDLAVYSSLVQPNVAIPEEVEELTGINQAMVTGAPPLITVLTELCKFVGPAPFIVGHNVGFDIRFVNQKLESTGLHSMTSRFDMATALCTKTLAQRALPGLPSYQGIVVATQCGVRNDNPHRAEADVRMSAGILFALIDKLRTDGKSLHSVADLLTLQGPIS
ncbi:MAG: 3'-5' exonuclease [Cyanobacteria bacterium HKST-UBA03]|nr:3'-5' exonuclease [Cyanobacteria bacterium HKST-UBA03]